MCVSSLSSAFLPPFDALFRLILFISTESDATFITNHSDETSKEVWTAVLPGPLARRSQYLTSWTRESHEEDAEELVASRFQYVDVSDRVILLCDSARNRSCYPSLVSPSFIWFRALCFLGNGLAITRNREEQTGMLRLKLAKSLTPTDLLPLFPLPLSCSPQLLTHSNFFLFSTAMLIAPIGVVFFLTLKSWHNLPFWMSSDPPRTRSKPACYYFIEDVGAVDFEHGREWRKRVQAR